MVEAMAGLLLTAAGIVVLSKQLTLLNHSGKRYFDSLNRGKMFSWKAEDLMRVRRSLSFGKYFIGALSFVLVCTVLGSISAHVVPSASFVWLTIGVTTLWASLQFPGEFKKELLTGKSLLVVCLFLPWPILLMDWMVELHPGVLFGFSRDLSLFGIEDPNRFMLAFYLSGLLTVSLFALRTFILIAMSLPALLLANCFRAQQHLIQCSHWCWGRSTVAATAVVAGIYLSWIG
ncbi:hypothetical protein ACFSJ3_07370 [Corallincola platygyrae]|uniref:Uncharacterized protein n=1 Tax=Corallincola platygyrae TaxID=1193278 RepID=A0ABW4XLY1_9GAMM